MEDDQKIEQETSYRLLESSSSIFWRHMQGYFKKESSTEQKNKSKDLSLSSTKDDIVYLFSNCGDFMLEMCFVWQIPVTAAGFEMRTPKNNWELTSVKLLHCI